MPQKHQSTKYNQGKYSPIPPELELLASEIVDAAYSVHKNLGPGLLEKIYEVCFCHELSKRGLYFNARWIFQFYMMVWSLMKV